MRYLLPALLFLPSAANAYIGPGAALSLIGYFFGLAGVVVVAVIMVAYYPVKLLIRKYRAKKAVDKAITIEQTEPLKASPDQLK